MTESKPPNQQLIEAHREELFEAIQSAESIEDCRRFFEDLCTPSELRSMADRWRVAQLLESGVPYRSINEQTGVSTATITRVARAMTYGSGGYKNVLSKATRSKESRT